MKNLITAVSSKEPLIAQSLLSGFAWNRIPAYLMVLTCTFLLSACEKSGINEAKSRETGNRAIITEEGLRKKYDDLSPQTLWELQQARAATAKYRNIRHAIADGYTDISVVVPNMGHHYMKASLVDGSFEIRKPEILVYNREHDGSFQLVAVEYAIPISASPDQAPEGFTGPNDVWDRNTGFGLWLLHAWVWYENPDGVFNPTNPLIHVH